MRQTNSADLLPSFDVEVVKLMMIEIGSRPCQQGQVDVFFTIHSGFPMWIVEVNEQAAIT